MGDLRKKTGVMDLLVYLLRRVMAFHNVLIFRGFSRIGQSHATLIPRKDDSDPPSGRFRSAEGIVDGACG